MVRVKLVTVGGCAAFALLGGLVVGIPSGAAAAAGVVGSPRMVRSVESTPLTSRAAKTPSVGAKCTAAQKNKKVVVRRVGTLKCKKVGKKLVWKKVAPAPVPVPTPTPKPTPTPTPTPTPGTYSFMSTVNDDGVHPLRWNPCLREANPIDIRLSGVSLTSPYGEALTQATAEVAKATKLNITMTGATDFMPTNQTLQDPAHKDGEITVFVGSRTSSLWTGASSGTVGIGGFGFVAKTEAIRVGFVVIDQQAADGMSLALKKEMFMHELGHVVNLGHVSDRTQVMNPTLLGLTGWGDGDLRGLARVGADAGCTISG